MRTLLPRWEGDALGAGNSSVVVLALTSVFPASPHFLFSFIVVSTSFVLPLFPPSSPQGSR